MKKHSWLWLLGLLILVSGCAAANYEAKLKQLEDKYAELVDQGKKIAEKAAKGEMAPTDALNAILALNAKMNEVTVAAAKDQAAAVAWNTSKWLGIIGFLGRSLLHGIVASGALGGPLTAALMFLLQSQTLNPGQAKAVAAGDLPPGGNPVGGSGGPGGGASTS